MNKPTVETIDVEGLKHTNIYFVTPKRSAGDMLWAGWCYGIGALSGVCATALVVHLLSLGWKWVSA